MILKNRFNVQIEYATNGEEALEMVLKEEEEPSGGFDIIFMDCSMPIMDGIEASERI